jgi:hypothetical protein
VVYIDVDVCGLLVGVGRFCLKLLEFRLKKKERQPKRTLATDSGENEGEKENPSTPCMNSEALKKFRQAAYELRSSKDCQ